MTPLSHIYRELLAGIGNPLLTSIQRGLEKEGLRVNAANALLSQAAHPPALGSALTHPSITTDYSEALLEFITPVSTDIDAGLSALRTAAALYRRESSTTRWCGGRVCRVLWRVTAAFPLPTTATPMSAL